MRSRGNEKHVINGSDTANRMFYYNGSYLNCSTVKDTLKCSRFLDRPYSATRDSENHLAVNSIWKVFIPAALPVEILTAG